MSYLSCFRDLTGEHGRLGFYTKETQHRIPESAGCYAWFVPLWLYREDLDEFLRAVSTLVNYEPDPEQTVDAPFNWERVRFLVRRDIDTSATERKRDTWSRALRDPDAREALQRSLIEASLLLPPLYIGKAANLRRRYLQHSQGTGDGNDFHRRFAACAATTNLPLSVSDLLFVCIETPRELQAALKGASVETAELDLLTEQILMQLCHPPFSLR